MPQVLAIMQFSEFLTQWILYGSLALTALALCSLLVLLYRDFIRKKIW